MSTLARVKQAGKPGGLGAKLFSSAFTIILAQGFSAAVGYLFWMVVTHWSTVQETGLASSAISLATLVSMASCTGIAYSRLSGASAHAPAARDGRTGLTAVAIASTIGALLVYALSPWLVPDLAAASQVTRWAIVVATILTALGTYVDYVAMSSSRSMVILRRSITAACSRLLVVGAVALALKLRLSEPVVTWAWAASLAISLLPSVPALWSDIVARRDDDRGLGPRLRESLHPWATNHIICLAGYATPSVLPVLVLNMLGKAPAGVFYPTWNLGSMFFMISPAIVSATLAKETGDAEHRRRAFKLAAALSGGLLLIPILICLAVPGLLLGLFGHDYAATGQNLLRVLALSAVPDALSNLEVALLRARAQFGVAIAVNAVITVTTLGLAVALLPVLGITGAGVAWIIGQTAGALLAVPFLLRKRAVATTSSPQETAVVPEEVAA